MIVVIEHLANFLLVTTLLKAEDQSTGNIYSSDMVFRSSICELSSMGWKADLFLLLFFRRLFRKWTCV